MGKKRIVQKGEQAPAEGVSQSPSGSAQARKSGVVRRGRIYVLASYNNTLMSLTDERGNVIAQVSAASVGFKGARKSTPFAASKVADALAQAALGKGMEGVDVYLKGVGPGRDSALRTFATKPFEITSIKDTTPIPHNGPTPRKPRRV